MTAAGATLPRVLVADDSAAVRRMVQQMFEAAQFDVVCASSGEEAFERALAEGFDAIVTDLTMEGLSGVQLCRILNSDPATREIPVVMLTATDSSHTRFLARHAGADGYITKGDARERLVATVEGLVNRDAPRPRQLARAGPAPDPLRRLSQALDEHLLGTIVSAEIRGLVSLTDDRASLGTAVVSLCGEVLDPAYAVLELRGPDGRSLTVYAGEAWPDDDSAALRELGIDAAGAVTTLVAPDRTRGPVTAMAAERHPITVGDEPLGTLLVFGGAHGAGGRTSALARHIAQELSTVVRSTMLLEQMRQMAQTDELTGLANRRRCVERLSHELERARRTQRPVCLMICDVDHFKAVNDTHGHNAGDDVLRAIASALQSRVRTVDLVGRWGGEEFIVVLPEAPLAGGRIVAERLRRTVEALSFEGPVDSATISAGVVQCDPELPLEALVQRADECLYEAKASGRNRVVAYDPDQG